LETPPYLPEIDGFRGWKGPDLGLSSVQAPSQVMEISPISGERRAPGCLGDLLGMRYCPVILGII